MNLFTSAIARVRENGVIYLIRSRRFLNLKHLLILFFLMWFQTMAVDEAFGQDFAGGNGTEAVPFQIETWEHLHNVRENLDAHFVLNNNLDENTAGYATYVKDGETLANSGQGWEPIGTFENGFTGVFNGGNNTISALEIDRPDDGDIGLFGVIGSNGPAADGELMNLNISDATIAGFQFVGSVAGRALFGSRIENVAIEGSLTGKRYGVGGAVGRNIGTLLNLTASVDVTVIEGFEEANAGGLVGDNTGTIQKSVSNGTVTGYGPVGGLVGLNEFNGEITESYATGTVTGTRIVGGLVGSNKAEIINSYASGDVTGNTVAGFAGTNSGTITNSYSTGFVTPEGGKFDIFGGFVATASGDSSVTNSYWDSVLSGAGGSTGGEGKSTAEMKTLSTFTDWDFDSVWAIQEGASVSYPYLQNAVQEPAPGLVEYFVDGTGTQEDPFQIETWEQLHNIRFAPEAHFQLMNNLTPATNGYTTYVEDENGLVDGEKGWLPIESFAGTLDGSHSEGIFTISGLKIDRPSATIGVGLFADIESTAVIKDLMFTNANITGANSVGVVAGSSAGVLLRVGALGTVQANSSAGGLIGLLEFKESQTETPGIERSFAHVEVTAISNLAGGLVGFVAAANNAAIMDSYATGQVTANDRVGGLIGQLDNSSVTRSYATGLVTATADTPAEVRGLVGELFNIDEANVEGSLYDTETTGQGYDTSTDAGIGKTTAEMKSIETYNGITETSWDFDNVWQMKEPASGYMSYPYLSAFAYDAPEADPAVNPIPGLSKLPYAGGSGTEAEPYQIETWEHLDNVRLNLDAHFVLNNDLDETADGYTTYVKDGETLANGGLGWMPIGAVITESGREVTPFTGTFDGNGKAIEMLKLNVIGNQYQRVGLFASMLDASVFDLSLNNARIDTDGFEQGILAGRCGGCLISNVDIRGSIVATGGRIGGIIGQLDDDNADRGTRIENSSVDIEITGGGPNTTDYVGGMVGDAKFKDEHSGIVNSTSNVTILVHGSNRLGGLIGDSSRSDPEKKIDNSSAAGTIKSTGAVDMRLVGGLVGLSAGTIINSSANVEIDVDAAGTISSQIGGLVGEHEGTIRSSYALGDIRSEATEVGGLVGRLARICEVENARAKGDVRGISQVGGLIGLVGDFHNECNDTGLITKNHALGNVQGSGLSGFGFDAAGFIGRVSDNVQISENFAAGNVTGYLGGIGGFIGTLDLPNFTIRVENNYALGLTQRAAGSTNNAVGGFIGRVQLSSSLTLHNNYSTARVSFADDDDPSDRGFFGSLPSESVTVEASGNFFDKEVSKQSEDIAGLAAGKTTAELKSLNTFTAAGWDFAGETANGTDDLWTIKEPASGYMSYPYLTAFAYDAPEADPAVNPLPGLDEISAPVITNIISGYRSVTIDFSAPELTSGLDILNYEYSLSEDAGETFTEFAVAHSVVDSSSEQLTLTIDELANGSQVKVRLRALTAAGPGPVSATSEQVETPFPTVITLNNASTSGWLVESKSGSGLVIEGEGENPDLYLRVGDRIEFENNAGSAHTLALEDADRDLLISQSGTGSLMDDEELGIVASDNRLSFILTAELAGRLASYVCMNHQGMQGSISAYSEQNAVAITVLDPENRNNQRVAAGGFLKDERAPAVRVMDARGFPILGQLVTFRGDGNIGFDDITNPRGEATAGVWGMSDGPGVYELTARVDGLEPVLDVQFTATAIDRPRVTLISPQDGAGTIAMLADFEWSPLELAEQYHLQVDSGGEFDEDLVVDIDTLKELTYTLTDSLAYGTAYSWRVRAGNQAGWSDWSEVFDFYSEAAAPSLIFPAANAVSVSIAPQLEWSGEADDGPWRVQLAGQAGFEQTLVDTLVTANRVQLNGLDESAAYYWRVRVEQPTTGSLWREDTFMTRSEPDPITVTGQVIAFEGVSAQDYRLISLPGRSATSPEDLFNGEYRDDWRLIWDNGEDEEFFVEHDPNGSAVELAAGRGYWALSREDVAVNHSAESVELTGNDTYRIVLHPGWNIISNPFSHPIEWSQVELLNGISEPAWAYSRSFRQADQLTPMEGYYFYNDPDLDMQALELPYSEPQMQKSVRFVEQQMAKIADHAKTAGDYRLRLWADSRTTDDRLRIEIDLPGAKQASVQRHPSVELAQAAMVIGDENLPRGGWARVAGDTPETVQHFKVLIKGDVGEVLDLQADLPARYSDLELLLTNPVTDQVWVFGSGHETAELTLTEPQMEYELYIGLGGDIAELKEQMMPVEVVLRENYPNPFNPTTNIRYSLPRQQQVRLEVYDVIGRRVQVLVDQVQQPGAYVVPFDGRYLASGIYIYRMHTGGGSDLDRPYDAD